MSKEAKSVQELREALLLVANPMDVSPMEAYMKNHFRFLGVKSPARKPVMRPFITNCLKSYGADYKPLVLELWRQDEREFQYIAIEYLIRCKRFYKVNDLAFVKELILKKSWWDTVDALASSVLGSLLMKFPEQRQEMNEWNDSEDMWIVRSSILYQLKYKNECDFEVLKRYILPHAQSKEFFIQKACGWALRQHAKFQPRVVKDFVDSNTLSSLTRREALKHIS